MPSKKHHQGVILITPLEGQGKGHVARAVLQPILRLLLNSTIDQTKNHTCEVIRLGQDWHVILTVEEIWLIRTPRRGMDEREVDRTRIQVAENVPEEYAADTQVVALPWPESHTSILEEIDRLPPSLVRRFLEG